MAQQTAQQTALVTGAYRGLGLACAEELARAGYTVLLTSRERAAGEAAAARLAAGGLAVEAYELDVADPASIAALARRLLGERRTLHALINNAGVSLRGFDAGIAERTLATNYFGAVAVTDALLPLVPAGGRVVMVSSGMGSLAGAGERLRARFLDRALDRAGVDALARSFVADVGAGRHREQGWPSNAYSVSKMALNAFVRVSAPGLAARGVLINAVCPGWVRTDMGGASAPRSLTEGAASITWAATLPPDGPTGGFFRDGRAIAW
jgi:NAD(P)-dependent dehydrogenase (short-subunit alcohol dehydrogenase family)